MKLKKNFMNNGTKSQNKVSESEMEGFPHHQTEQSSMNKLFSYKNNVLEESNLMLDSNVIDGSSNNGISKVKNIFKISTPLPLEPSQPSRIHTYVKKMQKSIEEHNNIN